MNVYLSKLEAEVVFRSPSLPPSFSQTPYQPSRYRVAVEDG